jgi:hypothetical protein
VNDRTSVRSELRRTMEDLSSREAQIIEMRFGLADGNPMTLEEIGKHFRVTRERIRQVSGHAISIMWRDFSRPFSFSIPSVLLSSWSLLCSYRLFFYYSSVAFSLYFYLFIYVLISSFYFLSLLSSLHFSFLLTFPSPLFSSVI